MRPYEEVLCSLCEEKKEVYQKLDGSWPKQWVCRLCGKTQKFEVEKDDRLSDAK